MSIHAKHTRTKIIRQSFPSKDGEGIEFLYVLNRIIVRMLIKFQCMSSMCDCFRLCDRKHNENETRNLDTSFTP